MVNTELNSMVDLSMANRNLNHQMVTSQYLAGDSISSKPPSLQRSRWQTPCRSLGRFWDVLRQTPLKITIFHGKIHYKWWFDHRIGWGEHLQASPTNLMLKTHGFPVKMFPTEPIHWTSDFSGVKVGFQDLITRRVESLEMINIGETCWKWDHQGYKIQKEASHQYNRVGSKWGISNILWRPYY